MSLGAQFLSALTFVVWCNAASINPQNGASSSALSTVASMEADIRQTGSALVIGLEFDPGQASWPSASAGPLERVRVLLRHHTEWRFEVQVHTDELNDRDADQALTDRRAEAVVRWMTDRGVESSRLVAHGFGSSRPRGRVGVSSTANRWVELRKLNEE